MADMYFYQRLPQILLLLHGLTAVFGAVLVALGGCIDNKMQAEPPLWPVGIMPLLLAALGIAAVYHGNQHVILAALLVTLITLPVCFLLFMVYKFLDPELYGVSIQIYSTCTTSYNTTCTCSWNNAADGGIYAQGSCETMLYVTTLFLCLLGILVCSLLCLLASSTLTFILLVYERKSSKQHTTACVSSGHPTTCVNTSYLSPDRQISTTQTEMI